MRELRVWNFCCGRDNGTGRETRGVLRGPRGPKNNQNMIRCFLAMLVALDFNLVSETLGLSLKLA